MSTETIITEAMSTEGAAISEIVKERRTMFRADISAKGYIVRLGNLMLQLEAIAKKAGKKKVSSKMIKEAGLSSVSSAIRCEAKWFVLNEQSARAFIKAGKFKGNNVSALKTAMAEADKAAKAAEKAKASTESESESEATEGETTENVTTEGDILDRPISVSAIAVAIHALASRDGKSVEDVIGEIIDIFDETNPAAIAA